ncbi:MAG: transposase [Actinomycetota bacterium]|nr:transposase [Actinomycetota bacterium]
MTRPPQLLRWHQTVSTYLPHLSTPQVAVLVLWSVGLILAHSCGLTTVATVLAYLLARREGAVREQLRDWYREASAKSGAKRGRKRRSLDVTTCFAPLLRWVVAWWDPACPQLALAMDASTLGQRFTILSISVVVRGCAIPVAWKVVAATRAGAWRPHWIALFEALAGAIPADWTVIVLADRGLYARWLFTTIQAQGWHPYLRINRQGQYCPARATAFRSLSQAVTRVGQTWASAVTCFATKERQLGCTLLARWDAGYRDPWLVVTDLSPAVADVAWYGLRAWIECGFKDSKRGGWQWQATKMHDPARAERLWLVIAVATLWTVSVGCQAEVALPAAVLTDLPAQHVARRHSRGRSAARALSCFRRGRLVLIAALCSGQELPLGRLVPEPWPKSLDTGSWHPRARIPLSKAA